jgi:hypothetical protein
MQQVLCGVMTMLILALPTLGWAQDVTANPPLTVFLECPECEPTVVQTEIGYVAWQQDGTNADLHVITRAQPTSGGGQAYQLDFTGLRGNAGRADTLTYYAAPEETAEVTGRGMRRMLTLGLMRYLANTPLANQVQIQLAAPAAGAVPRAAAQTRDPWNAWTFTVGGSGSASGETTRSSRIVSANFSGNRTTAAWKLNFRGSGSTNRTSIDYTIGGRDTTSITTTESTSGTALVVRSITGHTSVGLQGGVGTSTVNNTKFYVNLSPAVEYNFFPYSESTRRALALNYSLGMISQKYREETIYFRTEETRPVHSLSASYSSRSPWGNASVSLNTSQYLHDTKLYSAGMFGNMSVNLIRGLQMSFSGSYSRVRNQITLPRRDATQEEVLLRQRSLATNFRYSTSVGLSYRFGSSVQSVVNPRFGGGGGTVIFFD